MKGENTEKSEELANTRQVKWLKHKVFASLQDLINLYEAPIRSLPVYEMIAGLRAGETKAGDSWVDSLKEQEA